MSQKKSYVFQHSSDCETPYMDIYIKMLSINFILQSVLYHYAYHQISDFEIYTALATIW